MIATKTINIYGVHLGSTSLITDSNGEVVEKTFYEPFGMVMSGAEVETKVAFTGEELDEDTGQQYHGARYYKPETGQFISADTILQAPYDPQNLNRYSYVLNNPYKFKDSTGDLIEIRNEGDDFVVYQYDKTGNDQRLGLVVGEASRSFKESSSPYQGTVGGSNSPIEQVDYNVQLDEGVVSPTSTTANSFAFESKLSNDGTILLSEVIDADPTIGSDKALLWGNLGLSVTEPFIKPVKYASNVLGSGSAYLNFNKGDYGQGFLDIASVASTPVSITVALYDIATYGGGHKQNQPISGYSSSRSSSRPVEGTSAFNKLHDSILSNLKASGYKGRAKYLG